MQIEMAYGQQGVILDVPAGIDATIIRKKPLPVPDEPARVIETALAHPVSAPPLILGDQRP